MCTQVVTCGPVSDDDARIDAWRSLLLAHSRVLRAIEADLARKRLLPLRWYDVLLELNGAPARRLRMQELASRVVLSRTRVSRVVDELVREGLVERVPVTTSVRDGDMVGVTAGLAPGDLVVSQAAAFVREGDTINPIRDQADAVVAQLQGP